MTAPRSDEKDRNEDDLPPFVRRIEVPGEIVSEVPLTLDAEVQERLDAQLRAIDEAHANAARRAHEVVIWR